MVSTISAPESLPLRLGQFMAARAFLRAVRRIDLHYQHTAQGGLVPNKLAQLVKRPARPFGVLSHLSLSHVGQLLQHNAPTMLCGIVHNLLGHDVIFVLGAPGLLVANAVKKTPLPRAL
jgi:hypothetical protein